MGRSWLIDVLNVLGQEELAVAVIEVDDDEVAEMTRHPSPRVGADDANSVSDDVVHRFLSFVCSVRSRGRSIVACGCGQSL